MVCAMEKWHFSVLKGPVFALTCVLLGCVACQSPLEPNDLSTEQWKTAEEERLEALSERCAQPRWQRVGVICPDDLVQPVQGSS